MVDANVQIFLYIQIKGRKNMTPTHEKKNPFFTETVFISDEKFIFADLKKPKTNIYNSK